MNTVVWVMMIYAVASATEPTNAVPSFGGVWATKKGCERNAAEMHTRHPDTTFLCRKVSVLD